jgi:hypothetical protein
MLSDERSQNQNAAGSGAYRLSHPPNTLAIAPLTALSRVDPR